MAVARWRLLFLLALIPLVLVGCAGHGRAPVTPPATSSGPAFSFVIGNMGRVEEHFTILLDGVTVFDGPVRPGERRPIGRVGVTSGWHKVESRTVAGIRHQAIVDANRDKWIRILREPSKPEGVGVHITEYPTR